MDQSTALSYISAKLSGMLSKSFVGARAGALFSARTLPDLWNLLFSREAPVVPESILAQRIEREASDECVSQFAGLLALFDAVPEFFAELFRSYDVSNLKNIFSALCAGQAECPALADTGRFSPFDYKKWPDFGAVAAKSDWNFYRKAPSPADLQDFSRRCDNLHVRKVLDAADLLPAGDRDVIRSYLVEEYSLRNLSWALRLRVFYGLEAEQAMPLLLYYGRQGSAGDIIARDAAKVLSLPTDSAQEWRGWKYERLLNPWAEGAVWNLDPRRFAQEARKSLNRKALSMFHKHPDSYSALFAWFKIKQYELDCVRAACEGIRLNVDEARIRNMAGVD